MTDVRATLTRQRLAREIGRRTRLTNKQARMALDAMIACMTEQITAGGRIELSNFLTLDVQQRQRLASEHLLGYNTDSPTATHRHYLVLRCRPGKQLRASLHKLALKR